MARLTLRHIASILLLATYLPMVLFSSLHTHHDTVDSHDNCLQCAGHFETHHNHQHDCLFCNFLSLYYHGQPSEQPRFILPSAETALPLIAGNVNTHCAGVARLSETDSPAIIFFARHYFLLIFATGRQPLPYTQLHKIQRNTPHHKVCFRSTVWNKC